MKIFTLDNNNKYSVISRFFHWFRFLLLFSIYLGAYKTLFDHRTLGIIMFVFMCLNILWRLFNKAPKSFAGSQLEENIERAIHVTIYVIIFFLPVLGFFASMWDFSLFDINIPNIYGFDFFKSYLQNTLQIDASVFRGLVGTFHRYLTTVLLLLAGLHVFVIIFNRIFRKTGELKRMM